MDPRTQERAPRERRQGRIILVVCLFIDVLVAWVVLGGNDHTVVYARSVEEALDEHARSPSSRVARVSGVLVSGSLVKTGSCAHRFQLRPQFIADGTEGTRPRELSVSYEACRLPETFCDLPTFELELNVTGRFTSEAQASSFRADSVLAVCPSKYSVDRNACDAAPEAVRLRCPLCRSQRRR